MIGASQALTINLEVCRVLKYIRQHWQQYRNCTSIASLQLHHDDLWSKVLHQHASSQLERSILTIHTNQSMFIYWITFCSYFPTKLLAPWSDWSWSNVYTSNTSETSSINSRLWRWVLNSQWNLNVLDHWFAFPKKLSDIVRLCSKLSAGSSWAHQSRASLNADFVPSQGYFGAALASTGWWCYAAYTGTPRRSSTFASSGISLRYL